MTATARACLGALFGALLTLVLHPVSRPFLTSGALHVPPERVSNCVDANSGQPPPPHDLKGASLWLELAAERMVARYALKPGEVDTLVGIATHAADIDRQNGYWDQERAVFLSIAGRAKEAADAWSRASRATSWNDYQADRMKGARAELAHMVGAQQAWQLAYVLHQKSEAPAFLIERYARSRLAQVGMDSRPDLATRYETLLNGNLITNGAKSVAIGSHGANIIELTAYPRNLMLTPSPKRLWVGQNKLLNQLEAVGMGEEAARSRTAFRSVEGWRAFTQRQDAQDLVEDLTAGSLVSGTFVSACAFATIVGGLFWVIGFLVTLRLGKRPKLSAFFVLCTSLVLATLGIVFTNDLWAGLVGALAAAFLLAGPSNARNARPEDLGPLFAFLVMTMATITGVVVGAYAASRSAAGVALLPLLGVPPEYYSTPLLLGLASIFFCLLLVAVPLWALVQRLSTAHVLGLALRKLGAYIGFGALALGIVLGPVAVYLDRDFGQTLDELVGNEPVYYIVHP
jgi:hypothetical protein